jgi:hypothetical protein
MAYLTAWRALEFRWALAGLLATLLHLPSRLSRVHRIDLLYLALLTPVASPNPLLYQLLPTSIHAQHAIGRRRKDDTHVGTAARGIVA